MRHQGAQQSLKVSHVENMDGLNALSGPMEELAQASGALVFQHPAFFLPWARVVVANGHRPACLALWREGRLTGFLPLFQRRDRRALLARVLTTPRYGSSPPFDVMLADPDPGSALTLLVKAVGRMPWLEQRFPFDVQGTLLGGGWADRFSARGCQITRADGPDLWLHRCGGGEEMFRDSLPRKHRMNCERLERRLLAEGRIDLVTGGAALEPALSSMGDIVRRSWKDSSEMSGRGLTLLTDLARALAQAGMLRLWLARVGEQDVAYLLEIEDWQRRRHAFHNAQDENFGHFCPGIVILFNALRAAYHDGMDTYEYWGYRDYVRKFSNDTLPMRSVVIGRAGIMPALLHRLLRMQAK